MLKTERLYYDNSFLYEFEAAVAEASPAENGRHQVVLDRTAMYPSSGGQPFDTGVLHAQGREYRVVEVAERESGDAVVHFLEGSPDLPPGMPVRVRIDEPRRRDHMQQHSGQHVLSAAFLELFQLPTVSFHLGEEVCTIDLDANSLVPAQVEAAERLANRIVTEDRAVTIRYAGVEEARQMGIRKLPPRPGTIRIIDMGGFDLTACGGTHVRSTGQIGPILLRKCEKVRQGMRVEFVCGERGVRASRREFLALTQAAEALSAAPADLPAQVARLAAELKASQKTEARLLEQIADYEARELSAGAQQQGRRAVVKSYSDRDAVYARLVAKGCVAHGAAAALVTTTLGSPAVILAAASNAGLNAGAILKQALAEAGGRGGGSPELAQGGVADPEKLRRLTEKIASQIA
ncbi:MAG: alanyl-tRNA editing protein [Acidobacteria bacterium]|nr:alanyl-tRNA editing protein [Acidobacteriota bacterium]